MGDTVTIKGEVVKVLEDPNFVNCTVKLGQPMPPAGTETTVQLNTAQLEKADGGVQQQGQPSPLQPPQTQQPAPAHSTKK